MDRELIANEMELKLCWIEDTTCDLYLDCNDCEINKEYEKKINDEILEREGKN